MTLKGILPFKGKGMAEEEQKTTQQEPTKSPPNPSVYPWSKETRLLFTELSFNAGLETDRQLLTLSAGGLGLLITLLTTKGASSFVILWIYGITAAFFIASIFSLLMILDRNKEYINDLSTRGPHTCKLLEFLDKTARYCFRIAALLALILALTIATQNQSSEHKKVSDSGKEKTSVFTYDSANNCSMSIDPTLIRKSVVNMAIPEDCFYQQSHGSQNFQNNSTQSDNKDLAELLALINRQK